MSASVCGAFDCDTCKYHLRELCAGCLAENEHLAADAQPTCHVFSCTRSQGVDRCDDCTRAVCEMYERPELVCPLRLRFESPRWWLGKLANYFETKWGRTAGVPYVTARNTIGRLGWYLDALDAFAKEGFTSISSWHIAHRIGVTPTLVRKDLAHFGGFGKRGSGYDVAFLHGKIIEILGLDKERHIAWVGASRLLQDPEQKDKLAERNCHVVAVFDTDPDKLGLHIDNLQVMGMSGISQVVRNLGVDLAVIGCPESDAQRAVDQLASAGVKAFLNMTSAVLVVPANITVRNLDVASELSSLSYYCNRQKSGASDA